MRILTITLLAAALLAGCTPRQKETKQPEATKQGTTETTEANEAKEAAEGEERPDGPVADRQGVAEAPSEASVDERDSASNRGGEPASPAGVEADQGEAQSFVRLLIRGPEATQIANFVDAKMAATPGGVIATENMGCAMDKSGAATCGQIVAPDGVGYDLEHFGYDERPNLVQEEVIATTTMVSEEEQDGEKMLRIRLQGAEAEAIAKLLDPVRAAQGPVTDERGLIYAVNIAGKNHSCVISAKGVTTCGFILRADGTTYPLEHFGYQ